MTPPNHPGNTAALFPTLAEAVRDELEAYAKALLSMTLCSGEFMGSFGGNFYYRFEIPEHVTLRGLPRGTFSIGHKEPIRCTGHFVAQENQYLTVALPIDFGPVIPETECTWNPEPFLKPVADSLSSMSAASVAASILLDPAAAENHHAVSFEPQILPNTPADQQTAIKQIFRNRVTFVWGSILSGKTHLLAHLAVNYIGQRKRILFVDTVNERVDDVLLRSMDVGRELGIDVSASTCSVGLPAVENFEKLAATSLEHDVHLKHEEKSKTFQERVNLLKAYWRARVKHVLFETYTARLAEIRERLSERKKHVQNLTAELTALKEDVNRIQSASMMDKLKKGFGKDDLAAAQKKLADKTAVLKRLQSSLTALTQESLKIEANTPISGEDQREFNLAVKRIEELGGVEGVEESVRTYTAVDERSLLESKTFVGTTLTTALSDPRLQGVQFDLVMVDDAESISLPFLVALAGMAKEKMVVSGNPYQLGPESLATTGLAHEWLRRDIFLHSAKTDELHRLFDYTERNAPWCILLSSHFATTPKLSLFVASILFDDKINVFASPSAKGRIFFVDTSSLRSEAKQYIGRKRIIPHNELQTRKVLELVKHALMEHGRGASDVGVVVPFAGPTLYMKQQLRTHGIHNVEVGTARSFRGRRKKAIILDTVMAGVSHTMRPIDDKKIGEHEIVRLLNTVFSCVEEDLYVVADVKHFKELYGDRLLSKLLTLLSAQADPAVNFSQAAKDFDRLDWDQKAIRLSPATEPTFTGGPSGERHSALKDDAEFAVQMKLMAKKAGAKPEGGERNFERETYDAVHRVLGMRADVNLLAQFVGEKILFHHSYVTEQALVKLPITASLSEKDFRTLMEDWNTLIYEMSGGSKSDTVFFKQTPETKVRWDINALKAFYSADVDTIVEEGKQKLAMAVSKIFQECVGKPQPGNPLEWHTGYLNFLRKLEAYLGWISEQLRK
ncbi:MAG TPA: AAA domain-containing protein [Bacteroidota bacterium]